MQVMTEIPYILYVYSRTYYENVFEFVCYAIRLDEYHLQFFIDWSSLLIWKYLRFPFLLDSKIPRSVNLLSSLRLELRFSPFFQPPPEHRTLHLEVKKINLEFCLYGF